MRKTLLPLLFVLGTVLSACGPHPGGGSAPPDAIGMDQLSFTPPSRTISSGTKMEFVNDGSRALHVLVLGKDAQPRAQAGAPSFGCASGHRSEVDDHWFTPAWTTPGTYRVTCVLHPSMNLTVTVL